MHIDEERHPIIAMGMMFTGIMVSWRIPHEVRHLFRWHRRDSRGVVTNPGDLVLFGSREGDQPDTRFSSGTVVLPGVVRMTGTGKVTRMESTGMVVTSLPTRSPRVGDLVVESMSDPVMGAKTDPLQMGVVTGLVYSGCEDERYTRFVRFRPVGADHDRELPEWAVKVVNLGQAR